MLDRYLRLVSQPGGKLRPLSAAIAEVLADAFAESGRTQAQVGADAGLTQSQLSKYLRGARVPHIDVLDAICVSLGLDVAEVVGSADALRRTR